MPNFGPMETYHSTKIKTACLSIFYIMGRLWDVTFVSHTDGEPLLHIEARSVKRNKAVIFEGWYFLAGAKYHLKKASVDRMKIKMRWWLVVIARVRNHDAHAKSSTFGTGYERLQQPVCATYCSRAHTYLSKIGFVNQPWSMYGIYVQHVCRIHVYQWPAGEYNHLKSPRNLRI